MPQSAAAEDAATPRIASPASPVGGDDDETPPFPADTTSLFAAPGDFGQTGVFVHEFALNNAHHAVLHVRLSLPSDAPYLSLAPQEAALGPGEKQTVAVSVDVARARKHVKDGGAAQAPVQISYHRLFPSVRHVPPTPIGTGTVMVQLPIAHCPHCARSLDDLVSNGSIPEVCPFCFERLRPCPVCGTLNSWLVRRCVRDEKHIVWAAPDWAMLGGNPQHSGSLLLPGKGEGSPVPLALSRVWSYPMHPPTRRENALTWSAPACAYGIVAASASTPDGEAHLYAWDARTGAPLWEPYPLPHPVYPDRGGVAFAQGRIFAATVEGACVCVDAQRGTRIWETRLNGRVYGAVTADYLGHHALLLLVSVARNDTTGGYLTVLEAETGRIAYNLPVFGVPDAAPAFAHRMGFIHDDGGYLTAWNLMSGRKAWEASLGGVGTDAAPLISNGLVFSATSAGVAWCHDALTGEKKWSLPVTNAPFGGTPACDGTLLYLPAGDGLHLVSMATGQAVRRYHGRFALRSAPLLIGDTLVYGSTDGDVYGGNAARTPEKQYETGTVGSQVVASLAFSGGTVFAAATNGVLYALHAASLEKAVRVIEEQPVAAR